MSRPETRFASRSRINGRSAILAITTICLPLLAGTSAAIAAAAAATPRIGTQLAELKGSDTTANDGFGSAVAISGATAVVGAPLHANSAGRVYVFNQTASGWKQVAELKGSDTAANDGFGVAVAVSGTTIVVGSPAYNGSLFRTYVFTHTSGGWKQTADLKDPDTAGTVSFGSSVAISGSTLVVGAFTDANGAGRAYMFTKTSGRWKQTAVLRGSRTGTNEKFGHSVGISGGTAVVGAWTEANSAGREYVFTRTSSGWRQAAELKGSDTAAEDEFGAVVAVSGSTTVAGARNPDIGAGRAYTFTETTAGWKQTDELQGSDTGANDEFGSAVAIAGATTVVGAPGHDSSAGRGYLFTKTATGWEQAAELTGSDTSADDFFGASVAISGSTTIVGAERHANAGRAYLFEA